MIEERSFSLPRGFKYIGPFFASLLPLALWAFFVDKSEPANVEGGILCVTILVFFAVFCHLSAVRTRVRVTHEGIEVSGVTGTRSARWSDVRFAAAESSGLVFHLASARPLRASSWLEDFDSLVRLVAQLGLLRSNS